MCRSITRAESFVRLGLIRRDVDCKLRHQARVIEVLGLVAAQIGFGAGHPEEIAMDDNLSVARRAAVVLTRPSIARGNRPFTPQLTNRSARPVCWLRKCERVPSGNTYSPHTTESPRTGMRLASDSWSSRRWIKPVVFAQGIGNAVVGPGVESLESSSRSAAEAAMHGEHDDAIAISHSRPLRRISFTPNGGCAALLGVGGLAKCRAAVVDISELEIDKRLFPCRAERRYSIMAAASPTRTG